MAIYIFKINATVEAGAPRSAEVVHYEKKALGMKNKGWGCKPWLSLESLKHQGLLGGRKGRLRGRNR